jgi:hypothetical protein
MHFVSEDLTVVAMKDSDLRGAERFSPSKVNICCIDWRVNQARERDEVNSKFSSTAKLS